MSGIVMATHSNVQAIIFCRCGFCLFLSYSFFPGLISAFGVWTSTILPNMMWPVRI